ncbi:MAG: DUF805 domain-containing protein [Gemmatimonadota bacterium]|nr:DUF805 domain-containing protein [Gemmatimonadota bacterium]
MSLRKYFTFAGRLHRRGFIAAYGLPFLVLGALPGLLLPHGPTQVALESLVLLLVLPGIARRLHDVGLSLWVFLAIYGISPLVLALQTTGMFGDRRQLALLLSNVPLLTCVLALFVVRGSRGPNRFGDEPGSADPGA